MLGNYGQFLITSFTQSSYYYLEVTECRRCLDIEMQATENINAKKFTKLVKRKKFDECSNWKWQWIGNKHFKHYSSGNKCILDCKVQAGSELTDSIKLTTITLL